MYLGYKQGLGQLTLLLLSQLEEIKSGTFYNKTKTQSCKTKFTKLWLLSVVSRTVFITKIIINFSFSIESYKITIQTIIDYSTIRLVENIVRQLHDTTVAQCKEGKKSMPISNEDHRVFRFIYYSSIDQHQVTYQRTIIKTKHNVIQVPFCIKVIFFI